MIRLLKHARHANLQIVARDGCPTGHLDRTFRRNAGENASMQALRRWAVLGSNQ